MPEINKQEGTGLKFQCPNCGKIPQDQVMFLCNTCKQEDLVEREGVFICPSCL